MTVLRRLAAALAVVALLSPTAAACLQAAGTSCGQAASSHDCCEGPRLSSCPCGGELRATGEPAQRHTDPVRDLGAVSLAADAWEPVEAPRVASAAHDTSPPPRPGGDRLSLLSILLV